MKSAISKILCDAVEDKDDWTRVIMSCYSNKEKTFMVTNITF